MAARQEIQKAKNRIKGKKYGELDDILTAGSGMNKEERRSWKSEVDHWMEVRKTSKPGSKEHTEATAKVKSLMGW